MKIQKSSFVLAIVLLITAGSLFRVLGFAPQIAMGVFGAAVIRNKGLAFAIPLFSMLLSDILFEVLYHYGYSLYGGFYAGQVTNYLLMAGVVFIGFFARNLKAGRIILTTLAAPTVYFLLSNLLLWANGGGFNRPKTLSGLMLCYQDAAPFFKSGLINTAVFSALLFGAYFLFQPYFNRSRQLAS